MKKTVLILAALVLVCIIQPVPCFAEGVQPAPVRVFVDKKLVTFPDTAPFINKDDKTMVPIRFVSNELGAAVAWDENTRTVTLRRGEKMIVLVIGDTFAYVDGEKIEFGTKTQIVESRTMVPLRFISETFGAGVEWADATRAVYITTQADPPPPPAVQSFTLYFPDVEAQHLVPERRELALTKPRVAELIFDELLTGPRKAGLRSVIPPRTKLSSLIIDGGVAYLDLSRYFRDDYRGGAAAEQATLYSIINSLAGLPDIDKIQFLLEGSIQETILGNIYTAQPLSPRMDLVLNE